MGPSSFSRAGQYKSSFRVLAGIFLRSRETQRARDKQDEIEKLRRINQQQQQPPLLPHDPVLPGYEFGPKLISVCVNLAMKVGLRVCVTCMETVMDWLDIQVRLPVWMTVRTWLMRLGVAALEAPVEPADDWIWMADHSNQIGQEKTLACPACVSFYLALSSILVRCRQVFHSSINDFFRFAFNFTGRSAGIPRYFSDLRGN